MRELDERTPLMWAALSGNIEIVKYIVDKGADIEAKDKEGVTSLMISIRDKYAPIVKFLLSKGARFTKQDMEAVLKQISKEDMIAAGYYWDLHDATYR